MKKLYTYFFALSFLPIISNLYAQPNPSIYTNWEKGFTNSLKNTHDMALPSWGPYSDTYNGVSHIPAANNGFRFDVVVQPSFYLRNLIPLANVKRESGYHPWKATPDLSYFSYRFELEWKDKVFCDVSVSKVDEQSRLIKSEFVNNTDSKKSLALNIFNSIAFPYKKKVKPVLPEKAIWQKAVDYISFTDSVKAWNYNLVYDGQLRGQVKDDNAVSYTAVLLGKNKGEKLSYNFANHRNISNGVLMIRYATISGEKSNIQVEVNGKWVKTIELPHAKEYMLATTELDNLPKGNLSLSFKIKSGSVTKLDGFVLVKKEEAGFVSLKDEDFNYIPKQINAGLPNAVVLKFDDITEFYGIVWSDSLADKRELFDSDPDRVLSLFNNLVKKGEEGPEVIKINGDKNGWFKNIFSAPIIVDAKNKKTLYAYVVSDTDQSKVLNKLKLFNKQWAQAEAISNNQESKANWYPVNKAGETYRFSQQLIEATTLTNLIYPTFTTNQYVKHTTPGKRWSALYTWDSGFIGLGYSALNLGRALESLNAYTMDAKEQSAFLEHGTPLPVQAYLFNELWNKTQNIEYLKYFYPRLKRYYDFLGGAESSPTRKLQSNFIKTWDIFYNSGGWDDYSPQVFVHKNKLTDRVAPTVNTAHQIRFAKLLKMAAWQLGYTQHIGKYNEDITMYSKTLQENAWDDGSGYYGYVEHDAQGKAIGIMKHPSGHNFNMGIDGCSPLIAGICDSNQKERIIKHLFTKGELWTDYGITAIDQKAPYYNKDGYWNGRVWMPHQWFFWKIMLDLNEPEKAIQIGQTALEVWKRETEESYNCWENFSVETGHGGGWHQFGALSSPVLNWYSALFKPGTITHGFNVWPISQKFSSDNGGFEGKLKLFSDGNEKSATVLLCLNDENNYEAYCNGKSLPINKILEGLYAVKLELAATDKDIFNLVFRKKN